MTASSAPATPAPDAEGRPVAVVGAGTLGRRIALMLAAASGEVRLSEPDRQQRGAAVRYVEQHLTVLLAARGVPAQDGSARRTT